MTTSTQRPKQLNLTQQSDRKSSHWWLEVLGDDVEHES